MTHLLYVGLLVACLIGTAPLEIWLHTGVYAQWRRLLLTLGVVVVIFGGWDVYAIHVEHWTYARRYLLGITLPGHLPLEELLFFLVTPTCAILTLEAVRSRRPEWLIGDESPGKRADEGADDGADAAATEAATESGRGHRR